MARDAAHRFLGFARMMGGYRGAPGTTSMKLSLLSVPQWAYREDTKFTFRESEMRTRNGREPGSTEKVCATLKMCKALSGGFMRVLRFLPLVIIFQISFLAQTTTSAQGDPQAIAVVQAAITALGGATAIGQAQSWTFQAQMRGPQANGNVRYMTSTHPDTGQVRLANGKTKSAPLIRSYFIPALVGRILLMESQDPRFSILYAGTSMLASGPVTVVIFAVGPRRLPAQIWSFDASNRPVEVDFRVPAEIGARQSFPFLTVLSDYRSASGVFYPFQIVSAVPGKPPEIIALQSVTATTTVPPNDFNGRGGDLQ